MQHIKSKLTYMIIEDSLKVCNGIKERMADFTDWECCGFSHHVQDAQTMIQNHKPSLIFLDWALKGGSAYEVLYYVANLQEYAPYIIFNTGYQSENPEIPQEIINNFKIDKYLVKPLWENLRLNLPQYLKEAELKSLYPKQSKEDIWLTDIFKKRHHIIIQDIVCIQQHYNNPYYKIVHLNDHHSIVLKISWLKVSVLLQEYRLCFFVTNSREHIIIKNYIQHYQRPFVQLAHFKHKIEVVKDKLAAFEKWLEDQACFKTL
ncbi:hypothetical protein [Niabella aquatica]